MKNKHGDFIWYELLTPDVQGARQFYGKVLNWKFADDAGPGPEYTHINVPDPDTSTENGVGGMMQLTSEMQKGGAHPVWLGYIGVDDVDKCVGRLSALGGKVLMSAWDLPGVGRMAMVTDAQGVPFYIMRGAVDQPSMAFAADKPRPGHCAWNELATPDQQDAWRFYGELFGWQQEGGMDMGGMGEYQFIRHGALIGAMMAKPVEMPVPMWSYYFRVVNIDEAAEAVNANGGQVLFGPSQIPGDEFIITGLDPQGAVFSLVGARG